MFVKAALSLSSLQMVSYMVWGIATRIVNWQICILCMGQQKVMPCMLRGSTSVDFQIVMCLNLVFLQICTWGSLRLAAFMVIKDSMLDVLLISSLPMISILSSIMKEILETGKDMDQNLKEQIIILWQCGEHSGRKTFAPSTFSV